MKRYVTKAELLAIFQKKTFITLPPNLLQGLPLPGPATQLRPVDLIMRDVAAIPIARRAATRAAVVHHLQHGLVSYGALWFHGSSGLGKSTLAVLVARSQSVAWRIADLRDAPAAAVRSILVGIASIFRQTGARGLILDDKQLPVSLATPAFYGVQHGERYGSRAVSALLEILRTRAEL